MAYLEELSLYKNTVIEKIIEDMDLCKAVYYNNTDFLEQNNLEDPTELIYKNIFPFRFIPDTDKEMRTFITLTFGRFELINNQTKKGKFILNVFTHRDLFKTDYGKTRIDYIINRIDLMLNYKNILGIGKMSFGYVDEIIITDKYLGASLCYSVSDFNR